MVSLFRYALLCVLSSFSIILTRKRELVALLLCLLGVLLQYILCGSSLRCRGFVCSVFFLDYTSLLFVSKLLMV